MTSMAVRRLQSEQCEIIHELLNTVVDASMESMRSIVIVIRKTKIIPICRIHVDKETIKKVGQLKYLGSTITSGEELMQK